MLWIGPAHQQLRIADGVGICGSVDINGITHWLIAVGAAIGQRHIENLLVCVAVGVDPAFDDLGPIEIGAVRFLNGVNQEYRCLCTGL